MKICNNCVMDNSIEGFVLNTNNICNFCVQWEHEKDKYLNLSKDQVYQNLLNIKEEIKNNTKENCSNYDCIIGLSGGTDSSFVVYQAWKMKLNVLIIHLDNGWNTLTSNSNISRILEKTNFDYKTLVLDWEEFKDLQLSFLKAGVPDLELPTDHAIFSYIYNYAIKNKIKYIFSGINFATEHSTIPSWGWRKDDFHHINKVHKIFGSMPLKTFPKSYPFKRFYLENITKKIKVIDILNKINYNSKYAQEILKKEFDWQAYEAKHHESFFTMFFQTYILPTKFKIDKRKLHFSCLIRNSELTRKEALEILSLPPIKNQNFIKNKNFFLKKLSLTEEEFEHIMKSKPKKHSDYSKNWTETKIFRFLKKIIKKLIN